MSILPQTVDKFNTTQIKILMMFLIEIENTILKLIWNVKIPQIAKAIFKEENRVGGLILPGFQNLVQSYGNQNNMIIRHLD